MWRLPCLISIESTMKWLPQHVDRSMWKTFLCQVTTPMTRPSREFTRSRTIWDQPPAWQPKSRTTAFLVGFGSLHSAICWGWFYFWKLNGFCEFATKKTRKSSQVLLSYEILSLFFDIFSLLGFPPFTAARWALWEWRIARRVVSAWTRPATCGIAVALFMRKNIMFNTKDHRSSNIMIDPQLLSFGTFDQKADLPLPRSSSPKKMEERSKSLNASLSPGFTCTGAREHVAPSDPSLVAGSIVGYDLSRLDIATPTKLWKESTNQPINRVSTFEEAKWTPSFPPLLPLQMLDICITSSALKCLFCR